MSADLLLVFTTCPDRDCGERIAAALLERRLAACISIGAPVVSHYLWKGERESAAEVPVTIKTAAARYAELEQALQELHPYELPEILAVPVVNGLPGYLNWVEQCTETAS